MRVVFLTHYYPPELGAAPARIAALARGLAERGLQVTVHTGFPHYPSGTIADPYRNRPVQVEHEGPVRIVRSVVYAAPNRGYARRLADHTAFASGALATCAASGRADVVVAETPPLFTAAAGVAYAAAKRARLALNVSDLWPESAVALGVLDGEGTAVRAADALARACYRRASAIAAPTRGIVQSLHARAEARGKVVHVPPAVDVARFAGVAPRTRAHGAPLRVLYAGTLGIAQGLDTLIRAAALAGPGVVELLFAGEGPQAQALAAQASAEGAGNVRLLGPVAPERIAALYEDVDAGVVPLRDRRLFDGALPTKLFEALAAGRPAILAARGEAAALVNDAGAGLVVAPEDAAGLADAFRLLHDAPQTAAEMGRRGRTRVREFDRAAAISQWEGLLHRLAQVA